MDTVLKESTITKKAKTITLGITIVAVFFRCNISYCQQFFVQR